MDVRFPGVFMAVALTASLMACTPRAPQGSDAEAERQALTQRAQAYQRDAASAPTLTPARKAELQQLAADVRAWQSKTRRDDLRVTKDSVTAARSNDNPGGGSGCEDCPGYTINGDRICFLESEGECPVDDGSDLQIGRVCVYTCIWIGAEVEPARKGS